jgi:hypothetical protein
MAAVAAQTYGSAVKAYRMSKNVDPHDWTNALGSIEARSKPWTMWEMFIFILLS